MSAISPGNYSELLVEIKQRIRSAQYEALRAVKKELIALYWGIGQMIVIRQQGETWGSRSWNIWRETCKQSFLVSVVSLLVTFGICGVFIWIVAMGDKPPLTQQGSSPC